MPGGGDVHALHGSGWTASWNVVEHTAEFLTIEYQHEQEEWPWSFSAQQRFQITGEGVEFTLEVINRSAEPMPAGLGFHPYFDKTEDALYRGLHRAEWTTSTEGLPLALEEGGVPLDWWEGRPVAARSVDTVFEGREGSHKLVWPSRDLAVEILPCAALSNTAVYAPEGGDFFCIEPMSHSTDALNRAPDTMATVCPGEAFSVSMIVRASRATQVNWLKA